MTQSPLNLRLFDRVRAPWHGARGRLFLLVLLAMLPAVAVQLYGAWSNLQGNLADRKLEVTHVAAHAQGDFATLLGRTRTVFTDLVQLNEMRNPNNCTLIFTSLKLAYERLAPEATNLALADAQGNLYCAVNPVQGERNIAAESYFQDAVRSLDIAAGAYSRDPLTGAVSFREAYPVASYQGRVQTVIVATLGLNWLSTWQSETAMPAGAAYALLSSQRDSLQRVVDGVPASASSLPPAGAGDSAWLSLLPAGQAAVEVPGMDGVTRLSTLVPLTDNGRTVGYVYVGYPVAPLYAQAYQALAWELVLLALTTSAAMVLAAVGSESLFLRPLRQLMTVTEQVQGGDLAARAAKVRGLLELTQLAQAFDRMTGTLQQRESDRRRAQADLEQSEARFRAIFENSPAGINIMDMDRKCLDVNPAMCRMLGYPREELLGQTPALVTHPDDYARSVQKYQELRLGQQASNWDERRYIRKNGEVFWAQITVGMVRNGAGQPQYLVGMAIDVSEQRRILAELKESEARFRAIFESSPAGIGVMALDGRILDMNPAICQMYGYSREELLGQTTALVTHPDDMARSAELFQELIAGRRNSYWDERRYLRKNGEVFWAQVTLSMVRDAAGQPLYLVGMVADIDRQRQALDQLQESEARFRAILDNAAVGIAVMTLDRHIVQVNPTAVRLTGFSAEELQAMDLSQLAIEADRFLDRPLFQELAAGLRNQYLVEKRYQRKDGSTFWGRVNFTLVRDTAGQPLYTIGIIEDITEEKRAADRLAEQEAEYRHTLEQRIAERSQELNSVNERLREKAAQDAVALERTRLARDLHDAVTQTLFSATLIADVLPDLWRMNPAEGLRRLEELHQLNRGALAEMRTLLVELRPNALVEVPLPTLLRQLVEALAGRARLQIQLNAEGERKLPADVQIGLYRIAQEALNNVAKHARATQAMVTLRLGPTVRLTVEDNGSGFDPASVTADHLGLKIMHERAEAIQARLAVYSEPGEGTQLSVTWGQDSAKPQP